MIRDYQKSDKDVFRLIHRMSGFEYEFPDLDDPLFVYKGTVEEEGRPVQGIALKIQAEVYIWVDPTWGTPQQRWEKLQELTEEAKYHGWKKGLDQLICVIPPEIADSFEKRLQQIGMVRNEGWPRFTFDLNDYVPKTRVESEVQAT